MSQRHPLRRFVMKTISPTALIAVVLLLASGTIALGEEPPLAGTCRLEAGAYTLVIAERVPALQPVHLVLMAVEGQGSAATRATETEARELLRTVPVVGPGGKGIVILPGAVHYELHPDPGRDRTEYAVSVSSAGDYLLLVTPMPGIDMTDGLALVDPAGRQVPIH
jgi:hypothetical protein